jgi:hypothetical protein
MSNDNAGGLLGNPLPIVLLALLAAGVLIKHEELKSARPNDSERVKFVPAGQQDVEARLWQDPFAAVEKYEERFKPTTYTGKQLAERIEKIGEAGGRVKVIGVSVFGGSYSEAAESRRRTRFAVLSALGFHGYSPANPEAIGYFRTKLSGNNEHVAWPDPGSAALDFNLIGPAGSTMLLELVNDLMDAPKKNTNKLPDGTTGTGGGGYLKSSRKSKPKPVDLTVPYEWFAKRESPDVLLLWLNEDKLTDRPLGKLDSLIQELTPSQAASLSTSANAPIQGLSVSANERTPKIFVSSATIPSCDLDAATSAQSWNCFMEESSLLNELTDRSIIRTIGTDDVLAAALLWELWQRGVNRDLAYQDKWWKRKWAQFANGQDPATFPRQCADGLVLISEWDSDYARALSRHLTRGFSARCGAGGETTRVVRGFTYLRGLDGMLPDVDKSTANAMRKDDTDKARDLRAQLEDAPPEHAEGRSQYDYLRRLGDEIARLDNDNRFAENGVKAIGIVGSDVYDKLLILQALRARFKNKIFFTTDLDARYLHADQKRWARNLVVASNFDLSLHSALQKSTPPFRDGYQTATYLAALMVLEDRSFAHWNGQVKKWLRPQIFEIGRTGAVHLASPPVENLTQWITRGYFNPSAPADECDDYWAACKNIEPERPLQILSLNHLLLIGLMISLGGLSVALLSQGVQRTLCAAYDALTSPVPAEARVARFWLMAAVLMTLTVLATIVGVHRAVDASLAQGSGEPFVWFEGVSVWPTVVLRFVSLVIGIVLVIAFTIWMRRQAHSISERFKLPLPPTWKLARSRWAALWAGPHLDLASFGSDGKADLKPSDAGVEIASLWQNYLRATSWREMTWWILSSTVIVFVIGFALVDFFGRPTFPYRGLLVEQLYRRVTFVNALLLWLVIFWVGYETRACASFVAVLSDVKSVWPNSLLDREDATSGVPRAHLDDYLDFQLIVLATRRIYRLIYLPFVLLLFLVLARSSIFDAMDFPLALILVTGLALAYALYTAILLRKSAEAARSKALDHYSARLLVQARQKDGPPPVDTTIPIATSTPISAEQIKLLMERIRNTREGAFASLTQQPALQALLLPFGGYGGVQLVEYLINF